jgi:Yip1 domain
MSTSAMPSTEPSAPSNSLGRVIGVLFSPKATFDSIVKRPTWLLSMLLVCLVGVGVTGVFAQRVGWRSYVERQIEQSPRAQERMAQVPADQRDEVLQKQAKFWGTFGYLLAVAGTAILVVVSAVALLVAFNVIGGTKISFLTAMAIVSYAWVPYIVHGLLSILTMFLKDPTTIDIKNILASNPGALLSDDAPKWLESLLTSLDLFTIWVLLLCGFGFSATNPKKLSVGKSFATVVGVWLIWVFVKMGLAAAFS